MLTVVGLLFFFQCVLSVMFLMNLFLGAAAAIADQDIELAMSHFYWGGAQAVLSIVVGIIAFALSKGLM